MRRNGKYPYICTGGTRNGRISFISKQVRIVQSKTGSSDRNEELKMIKCSKQSFSPFQ
jgi:hypothetical protein